jgi:hypothetical protein
VQVAEPAAERRFLLDEVDRAEAVTGNCPVCSAVRCRARATAMDMRSSAFSVAASGSLLCTQDPWSRMLAIENRDWFRPLSRRVSWKIASCVRGEHEATTNRLSLCFLIMSLMCCRLLSEHV